MRIIAGRYKGTVIPRPKSQSLRPTTDRTREAVFSALGAETNHAHFLDLFAGSGSVGLEALSRGAEHVTFVDCNRSAVEALRALTAKLALGESVEVMQAQWSDGVKILEKSNKRFHIAYLDPPYDSKLLEHALSSRTFLNLIEPQGLVIIERRSANSDELALLGGFDQVFSRQYGESLVEMFRNTQ